MLNLREQFGSSEKASIEGVWVPYGEGSRLRIARLGNPDAQKAYRNIPPVHRRQIEDGTMSNEQSDDFMASFIASHLLKDWEGVGDEVTKEVDGELANEVVEIEFSLGNALKMLKKYRRLRDYVWNTAMDERIFNVVDELETASKNSSAPSDGSSATRKRQSKH